MAAQTPNPTPTTPDPTQAAEQPVTREREVIVTNNSGGNGSNSSMGNTLLAIVGLVIVVLVGYFAIQAMNNSDGLEVPTEFDVNIQDGDAPAPAGDSGGQ